MTSTPTTRGRINHRFGSFLPVLTVNAVLGIPGYFIAFLFAYGFRDTIGTAEHLTFLGLVAVFAVVCGLVALFSAAWEPEARADQLFAFGILASLSLNSLAVGIGSIVSALNKDQNSVSEGFSTTTDVLVAAGLLGAAALLAVAADRSRGVRR